MTNTMRAPLRIMIVNNGVVRQIGTADEILNRPANVFVAQFFGDPPINLVEGVGRGDHVDLGDLKIPISAPEGRFQVGIRPTDIYVADAPLSPGDVQLPPDRIKTCGVPRIHSYRSCEVGKKQSYGQ
jgi:ABC-type sugar transport system ATPase subunit